MWLLLITLWLLVTIYLFSKRKFDYWEKRNVPHLKPVPFFGNYGEFILLRTTLGNVISKICNKFPKEPYIGSFYGTEPSLIVQDPELIKIILTKDFHYFNGREISDHVDKEPSTQDIFFAHGDKWKILRQNLSPLFTTAKIRNLFPLVEKCTRTLEKLLEEQTENLNVVKVNCIMARYTLDCVGSAAFGVDPNAMQMDFKTNHFKIMSERIFEQSTYRGLRNICRAVWPSIFYNLGFEAYRRDVVTFFSSLLFEAFKQRNGKPSGRHSFVDLILTFAKNEYLVGDSMKKSNSGEFEKVSIKVNDELLASQCVSFLGAGYETSATTLFMTLFEMAKKEYTQEKAIEEVDRYLDEHDNILDSDCVSKLPYLEACIDEALRFYPSLPNLTREVMEDYTFPTGLHVEKGVRIHLPLGHIHRNAAYFPDPETYRPERFLPEERANIKPYTYMPFGEGYRICIGLRFAKMQILAGLVTVFKSYRLQLAEGQPTTLEFDPRVVVNKPRHDVYLKFIPREDGRRYKNYKQ